MSLPRDFTNEQILSALEAQGWNVTRAAAKLGCHRESLRRAATQRLRAKYAAKKADGSIRVGFRSDAARATTHRLTDR